MELDLTEAREYFLLACRAYVPSDPFLLILTTNSKAVKYLKAGDFLFPVVLPQIHDTEERNLIFHKLMKLQFPPLIYSLKKPVLHMKESPGKTPESLLFLRRQCQVSSRPYFTTRSAFFPPAHFLH